jgi:hypothetical protein
MKVLFLRSKLDLFIFLADRTLPDGGQVSVPALMRLELFALSTGRSSFFDEIRFADYKSLHDTRRLSRPLAQRTDAEPAFVRGIGDEHDVQAGCTRTFMSRDSHPLDCGQMPSTAHKNSSYVSRIPMEAGRRLTVTTGRVRG